MKEAEKEDAIKLIKEWQEKRPNFSRTKLAEATGVSYPTLLEFGKQGLIELPEKRHTTRKNTSWGRLGIPKEWPTK
jgi:hypothetical protein|tara:strand:- start:231 stop:458 length:228 start_codon:yes stop_codon:yes gene_type:complete